MRYIFLLLVAVCLNAAGMSSGANLQAPASGLTVTPVRSKTNDESIPLSIGGVDHLASHVSVQSFWVNGYAAGHAGSGGGTVCCVSVPRTWVPGVKVVVRWEVLNWRDWESDEYEAAVEVEPYSELGDMEVHFLANGRVRVVVAMEAPWSSSYPGPRDPIPRKEPWEVYGEQHRPTRCLDHRSTPPAPCSD